MTLDIFLTEHTPLTAVELLPDNRLINVVLGDGALYGVQVENIPSDAQLTRVAASLTDTIITTTTALTFDTTTYTMIS
jgi:hypothetical protein